jgi:hypothetical protein
MTARLVGLLVLRRSAERKLKAASDRARHPSYSGRKSSPTLQVLKVIRVQSSGIADPLNKVSHISKGSLLWLNRAVVLIRSSE